jgi:hypothetical protein
VASTLLDVMDDDVATSLVRPLPRRRYWYTVIIVKK